MCKSDGLKKMSYICLVFPPRVAYNTPAPGNHNESKISKTRGFKKIILFCGVKPPKLIFIRSGAVSSR